MSKSETFKNITQGFLHIFIIIAIVFFGIWVILSVVAGFVLKNPSATPAEPSISKAQYLFVIKSTNELIYTDNYAASYHLTDLGATDLTQHTYTLQDYYELQGKKFVWHKSTLLLDEYYCGSVQVIDREASK